MIAVSSALRILSVCVPPRVMSVMAERCRPRSSTAAGASVDRGSPVRIVRQRGGAPRCAAGRSTVSSVCARRIGRSTVSSTWSRRRAARPCLRPDPLVPVARRCPRPGRCGRREQILRVVETARLVDLQTEVVERQLLGRLDRLDGSTLRLDRRSQRCESAPRCGSSSTKSMPECVGTGVGACEIEVGPETRTPSARKSRSMSCCVAATPGRR